MRLKNEVGEARNEFKFTYGSIGITGISYRQVSFRIENVKKEQKLCERCATRKKGEREKECEIAGSEGSLVEVGREVNLSSGGVVGAGWTLAGDAGKGAR